MSHDTTIQNNTSNEISQWHLTIKTVSSEHAPFTIPISPKDTLDTLQRIITEHTNLQPTQQRLIYRGRMLNAAVNSSNGEDCTIDSVDGLCDGQTIHLVPRPAGIPPSNSNSNSNQEEVEDNNEMFAEYTAMQMGAGGGDPTETIMGEMFSRAVLAEEGGLEVSLLSLLLGATSTFGTTNNNNANRNGNRRSSIISDMRLSNEDDDEDNEGDESEQINNGNSWRRRSFSIPSTSLDRNSIRRGGSNAANLSSDAQQPNSTNNQQQQQQQGSAMEPLEPIRQNLMTLNTMLRHHDANLAEVSVDSIDANRRFYRGQWIDCLDTVNQWLEATVIDVVDAADLLVDNGNVNGDEANLATNDVTSDEGISALEDVQSNTIRSSTAFREQAREPLIRSTNLAGRNQLLQLRDERTDTPRSDCVQLLLVHYNGWPSETWDEWIRSDSHRIRPFRTRTVHRSIGPQNPNGAMSPSVQNPVLPVHAPRTHVALEEEANLITSPADDRLGVLQEVTQTLGDVQGVLNRYVHPNLQSNDNDNDQINSRQLPWRTNTDTDNSTNPMMTRREELRIIAPLLDRLGRALVDIAPQLADLAEEPTSTDPLLPNNNNNTANNDQEEMEEAEGLSGLFDDTPPSDVNQDANHSDFVHAMVHTRNTNTNTSNTNTATLHNLRSNANTNTNTASNVTVTDAGFLGPLLAAAAQGGGRVFRQGADGRTTEIQIQVGMGPTLEEHNRNDDNDRNRNSNGNRNRQSDDNDSAPRDRSNDQRAEEAMHELYEEDGVMDAPLGTVQQQRNLQANLADEADDNEDDDDTGSLPPLLSNYTSSSMGSNQSSDFGDDDVSDDVSSDGPPALLDYSDEDSIYIEVHTNRYPDNDDDDHEEESDPSDDEDSMPPLDDNYDCYSSSDSNSSDVSSSSSSSEDEDMPALESIPIETKGNIPDDVSSSSSSDEEDGDASSSRSDEDMPVLEAIDDTNIARSVNASCAVVVDTPAPVSSSLSLISPAASSDDVRIEEEEEEDEGRSISSVDTSSSGEVVVAAKRVRRAADSDANEDESVNAVVGAATTTTATGVVGGTRRSVVSPSRWGGIFRRFSSSSSPSPSN